MADPKIHIIVLSGEDVLDDRGEEYPLSAFGGVVPEAGDWILNPKANPEGPRPLHEVRQVWEVVRRFFWALDLGSEYLVLIVREREARITEAAMI